MKHLLIIIVLLLTACTRPTPTPAPEVLPIPGDPQIITIGDIEFAMPTLTPLPPDCHYTIHGWAQFPKNPNGIQAIGGALDYCDHPVAGKYVTVCVGDDCQDTHTDSSGQISTLVFNKSWGAGVVPYTVCIEDDQGHRVCLESSFMAESED